VGLGVVAMENGHVHCINTSFVDVGVGVTVRWILGACAYVYQCIFV